MIHIEKDQKILENENLRVYSQSGDYQDDELIEVYDVTNPEIVSGAFAAQYIRYGGLVYKFNDSIDLGKEILLLDPESTHATASFVRMKEELFKKLNQGELEPQSLQQTLDSEKTSLEEKLNEEANLGTQDIQEQIVQTKENIEKLGSESVTNVQDPNPIETNTSLTESTSTPTEIVTSPTEIPAEPPVEIEVPVINPTDSADLPTPFEDAILEEPLSILTNTNKRKIA
jgi:hypothetical protein